MSYRIIISSFAAIAIGMSCIATDASARGGAAVVAAVAVAVGDQVLHRACAQA